MESRDLMPPSALKVFRKAPSGSEVTLTADIHASDRRLQVPRMASIHYHLVS